MYRIEQTSNSWHPKNYEYGELRIRLDTFMSRDAALMRELKDAMRQAASNLETLKLLKPDQDPRIQQLLHELRASSVEDLYRETISGD